MSCKDCKHRWMKEINGKLTSCHYYCQAKKLEDLARKKREEKEREYAVVSCRTDNYRLQEICRRRKRNIEI